MIFNSLRCPTNLKICPEEGINKLNLKIQQFFHQYYNLNILTFLPLNKVRTFRATIKIDPYDIADTGRTTGLIWFRPFRPISNNTWQRY